MLDLSRRDRQPEVMDDPDIDPAEHRRALRALRRVNAVSRSVPAIWNAIERLPREADAPPLRILDVACGGGDVAVGLWRRAQAAGVEVEVAGCDLSAVALQHARGQARRAGAPIELFECDVLASLPDHYDVICCSLFLHHLSDEDAVRFLALAGRQARRAVLIDDLVRSWTGYWLAWIGVRLLTFSRIAHTDGPLSVRAAFTPREATDLAAQAGLDVATITRRWPQRYLLSWVKRGGQEPRHRHLLTADR